jgi:hypothetical protein
MAPVVPIAENQSDGGDDERRAVTQREILSRKAHAQRARRAEEGGVVERRAVRRREETPIALAEGEHPAIHPRGERVRAHEDDAPEIGLVVRVLEEHVVLEHEQARVREPLA